MGTGNSLTDENTEWLDQSVVAARRGPDVLRATWEALAVVGKLPNDIDMSDPDAIDWDRITEALLGMAAFEQRVLKDGPPEDGLWSLDEAGQLTQISFPTEKQVVK